MEPSTILKTLAARYRASRGGSTGQAAKDFIMDYRKLLAAAEAEDGEALVTAEQELQVAAGLSGGLLTLERHPRDARIIERIRLVRDGGEAWLFQHLGLNTPASLREQLAATFSQAASESESLPQIWQTQWNAWCLRLAEAARSGRSTSPFFKENPMENAELLRVLREVLNWPGESLIRFASCVICGDSKQLESLAPRLEQALAQLSDGTVTSLEALGLLENPRFVLIHGPLILETSKGALDLSTLEGPIRLSDTDLAQARAVITSADRCLSIENETTFHELAKLHTGILLVQTSHPGRGVRALYERLPADLSCWHFGDTDPAGFDILRDLRVRLRRTIQPLHMNFRDSEDSAQLTRPERSQLERLLADPVMQDLHSEIQALLTAGRKGRFEQESLGWPKAAWPFYT